MELDKGVAIEKLNIKDGDTLIVTFDTDIWDVIDCSSLSDFIQKQFPNNNIIFKLKGIDLEVIENNEKN